MSALALVGAAALDTAELGTAELGAEGYAQIALTTLAATLVVTVLTVLLLRSRAGSSLSARWTILVAGALVSVAASVMAVAGEMFLSGHDANVLAWVIGISAPVSLAAALLVARASMRRPVDRLVSAARRVGDGDVVSASETGLRELDAVDRELAQASTRLAAARGRIAELDAARRDFFAWISHDLRTPLAGIRATAESLELGTAPDAAAAARVIRGKVDTLTSMVADLFELSRMQTGTLDIHPEVVELLDLVSDAVADVRPAAEARGIRIVPDGVEGRTVWADPRELTRALGNLLVNAVRHAPRDSSVFIRADATPDRLTLSVIDQGPGVTSEHLARMFEVGWKADDARSDDTAATGAGLGLAIVRGIAEAHGGSVRALHDPEGFRLALTIPDGRPPVS